MTKRSHMKPKKPSRALSNVPKAQSTYIRSLSDESLIAVLLDHSPNRRKQSNRFHPEIIKTLIERKLIQRKNDRSIWSAKALNILDAIIGIGKSRITRKENRGPRSKSEPSGVPSQSRHIRNADFPTSLTGMNSSVSDNEETARVSQQCPTAAARAEEIFSKCSGFTDRILVSYFCVVDNHPASEMRSDVVVQVMEQRHLVAVAGENIVLTEVGKVILKTILKERQEKELKEAVGEKP
jgi:hypothetical protein